MVLVQEFAEQGDLFTCLREYIKVGNAAVPTQTIVTKTPACCATLSVQCAASKCVDGMSRISRPANTSFCDIACVIGDVWPPSPLAHMHTYAGRRAYERAPCGRRHRPALARGPQLPSPAGHRAQVCIASQENIIWHLDLHACRYVTIVAQSIYFSVAMNVCTMHASVHLHKRCTSRRSCMYRTHLLHCSCAQWARSADHASCSNKGTAALACLRLLPTHGSI